MEETLTKSGQIPFTPLHANIEHTLPPRHEDKLVNAV
jgi:hypothetical protein